MFRSMKMNRERFNVPYWPALLLAICVYSYSTAAHAQSRGIGLQAGTKIEHLPFKAGTYRALIIGNNDYRKTGGKWPPLKTAVSDAQALKQILTKNYHFSDVQLLENATRRDVLIALQSLSRRPLRCRGAPSARSRVRLS